MTTTVIPSPAVPADRLRHAIEHATGRVAALPEVALSEPGVMAETLSAHLGSRVIVTGTLDRRLFLVETSRSDRWTAADLSGAPHKTRAWPPWASEHMSFDRPSSWLSGVRIADSGLTRLLRPRLLLAALYHPEHFPLPRFPLGISDLARAARATVLGQVELMDMQLGIGIDELLSEVVANRPEIVGISATFGQHDLMTAALDELASVPDGPLVIVGGSLTARNERLLLERYPKLLVARGAGEATVADVLAYWHGDLQLDEVRGIGYQGAARGKGTMMIGRPRRTAIVANRAQPDIWPELDLLPRTFAHKGVAQLETSRGCTNFCSFCPRGHKGMWAGVTPDSLAWVLDAYAEVFDAHPAISRTLYLVDEEFIGRGADAVPRAIAVADMLNERGFSWETSCRVDQVVHRDRDREWHVERGKMWRQLVGKGLRRCLFGVESGVTSILDRFNKETTGEQNVLAVRTLSALGVPTRFTYITFDHLMTAGELHATHAFQGRTDLLLRPVPHLDVEEIVDGVRDDRFVAAHAVGTPFYSAISYLLVSMECLIGAAYTRAARAAGLTGAVRPAMGRVDARFADWRIGVLSQRAQLWIDRNFALDYTLKSLEKLADGPQRRSIREARIVLKDAAYALLSGMLNLLDHADPTNGDPTNLDEACTTLAEHLISMLRLQLEDVIPHLISALPPVEARKFLDEHARWAETEAWHLINAAESCGA